MHSLFKELTDTVTVTPEKQLLKKCTSCLKLKPSDKYKYIYSECTACYAKKKNPNPNQYGIRLNSRSWA